MGLKDDVVVVSMFWLNNSTSSSYTIQGLRC